MVFPLRNAVQPYAWGSPTAIPELFGLHNPSGGPMAEIWMGAHRKAPSRLVANGEELPLDAYIASDPAGTLGAGIAARYGGTLPFLFKVLSAGEPLSIQAHPSKEQAEAGFAREEAAGTDRGADDRNYRDDNHKPELIYALTEFWGMRGFRAPAGIRSDFAALPGDAAAPLPLPGDEAGLRSFFRALMTLSGSARGALTDSALRLARTRWPDAAIVPRPGDSNCRYYWVQVLAQLHPGDVGALAPLFLDIFSLRPGEATYQPAGVLHAYLRGTGAELMANSDNVLRGGLTAKHIDLDELLSVGVFRAEPSMVIRGTPEAQEQGCRAVAYPAPFDEFAFSRIDVDGPCELRAAGPRILLCSSGKVHFGAGADRTSVSPGESVFARADEPVLAVSGSGVLLQAAVGAASPR